MARTWTCRICNEKFQALRGFSMHLNSHNYTEHSNEDFRKQYFQAEHEKAVMKSQKKCLQWEHEKALTAKNIPHMEDQGTVIDDQEVALVQEKEKNEAVRMQKSCKRKRKDIVEKNRMEWRKVNKEIHDYIQAFSITEIGDLNRHYVWPTQRPVKTMSFSTLLWDEDDCKNSILDAALI